MNHLEMALDISYQLSKLLGCIIFLTNESGVDGYIRYKCG